MTVLFNGCIIPGEKPGKTLGRFEEGNFFVKHSLKTNSETGG